MVCRKEFPQSTDKSLPPHIREVKQMFHTTQNILNYWVITIEKQPQQLTKFEK